jgi:hypothetical protein
MQAFFFAKSMLAKAEDIIREVAAMATQINFISAP